MSSMPRLLLLSAVWPFPRLSGQQQRVFYKLKAFRERFHVTFLTFAPARQQAAVRARLLSFCDEAVVLPSRYHRSTASKVWHRFRGGLNTLRTGLKFSNYVIGRVEFPPQRVAQVLQERAFDGAVFEYWHAAESIEAFHAAGIPCILDMHNVLWQSYRRQLQNQWYLPRRWREWAADQYRLREESAWNRFDALIAINAGEQEYVGGHISDDIPVFYAPMGIDLERWPYCWQPAEPSRIAYYGSMGSAYNQHDALHCSREIMPGIWKAYPEAEFWIVGGNPPASLRALAHKDDRVTVTGYVEEVQEVLRTMHLVLCPWSGTYGFRSRLVEVMALGVPVVASPEAVYGMRIETAKGLLLGQKDKELIEHTLNLIQHPDWAKKQSLLARQQIEEKFNLKETYDRLAQELCELTSRLRKETS